MAAMAARTIARAARAAIGRSSWCFVACAFAGAGAGAGEKTSTTRAGGGRRSTAARSLGGGVGVQAAGGVAQRGGERWPGTRPQPVAGGARAPFVREPVEPGHLGD